MGWNSSSFATNSFRRYLARLRKLITGAGLKVAHYVRPRQKAERPNGSTVRLELGQMEGRESFNPVGQLGMAIGGAAALGALIHQLASAPASSSLAEVTPGNEDGTSGQWEGHPPQEFVVGAASDYPTVSYAGWQPGSAQPGEGEEFDNFFSAASREASGGGVPAGDAGGGGGGDPVSSGGPSDGRSAEQPFAGGAERQSDPSGLDQSMANVAPPTNATTPAALDAGTQIAPLPPIAMAQMPFAGTGATFEAKGAMPQVPSPGSTSSGIVFTPNRGQADPEARFVAHAPGFDLALAPDRVTFDVGQFRGLDQIHMEFVGANESPEMIGVSPVTATAGPALLGGLGATVNIGQGFSQVNYQNLYSGINLDFYVNAAGKVEHDFVVAPGADPNTIKVSYLGADRLELDGQGSLHIYTATSGLVQHAPVAYQQYGGVFEPVRVNYVLEGNTVTFGLGAYDPTRTLVIDPVSDVLTPSGTFRAPVVGSAGSTPNSAAAADFDNDGDDDALIANFNGANLTLALSNGNGTFATGVSIAAGNGPNGLAIGDLTGNGEKDIVVSNYYDNTVGVIRSNGDGTFQSMVTYAVGSNPANTALGDFDGDGHLDIATANHGAGTVSVLLNNGDGTFASAVSYTAQSATIGIAAADLDGDDIIDLAAANYGSNSVTVFIGNGDGTFATGVNYSVGANPFYLAAGDFREDGFPDLVTANFGSNTVSRLTNNGDGTFASAVNTTVGSSPTSLAVGNLYGRPTLVVGNFGSSDVSLLLTNPDGSFQTEQRFAAGVTGPNGMALGDFKGDGKLSVLVGGESSGTFAVLLNGTVQATQGVSFTGPVAWFTDSNTSVPASAFTATIDWGDGTTSTGTVQADPAGGFVVLGTHTYEKGSYPITVDIEETGPGASTTAYNLAVVTDFLEPTVEVFGTSLSTTEGTPLNNVVVATFTDPGGAETLQALVLEAGFEAPNVGTGTFGAFQYNPTGTSWTYVAGAGVAGNGSGFTSGNPNAPQGTQVGFLQDTGSSISQALTLAAGTYTVRFRSAQRGNYQPAGAQSVRVSIDSTVLGTFTPSSTTYEEFTTTTFTVTAGSHTLNFEGLTTGDSTAFIDQVSVPLAGASAPYVSTIDWGDGSTVDTGTITYDSGTGVFSVKGSHTYAHHDNYIATVRVTNQGRTNDNLTLVSVAEAAITTTGMFSAPVQYSAGSTPDGVATGDLDGDGKQDAVVANYNGNTLSVFLGNGDGTLQSAVNYATGSGPNGIIIEDFDGDTIVDLAVGNYNDSTVTVYIGNGDGTFTLGGTYTTGSNPANRTAVGDFDGDTYADLAFADHGDGTISVLFGNGDGTFQSPVTYSSGASGTIAVVAGDVDGDTDIDLVAANNGSNSVSVFLNNGSGTFASAVTYACGANPWDINLIALGTTGYLGIATANFGGGSVSVLRGNGDGTFQSAVSYAVGANPTGVAVAEFNGRPDLIVSNFGSSTVSLLLANADGTFQTAQHFAAGNGPNGIAVADFDDDDKIDVITADQNGNTTSILLNQSVVAPAGQLFSGKIGSFTSANPLAEAGSFHVLINWGDGITLPGTVVANGSGGFDIIGNHFYDATGAYQVSAEVTGSTFTITNLVNALSLALITRSVTVNGLNNSTTGTVTYNDGAGHSGSISTYLSQLNVTLASALLGPVTFNTFCIDLFHTVSPPQTYDVYAKGDVTTAYVNGGRMAYIYETYALRDLTNLPTEAAAIQIALWALSLDNNSANSFTYVSGNTYGCSTPSIFSVDFGSNPNAATIAARVNTLLSASNTLARGGRLDADAAGFTPGRGQSLMFSERQIKKHSDPANYIPATVQPRNDTEQSDPYRFGIADASLVDGSLRTRYPLCLDCGCSDCQDKTAGVVRSALVYNSGTVKVRPIIETTLIVDPGEALPPDAIEVTIDWGSGAQIKTEVFYPLLREDEYYLPIQLDSPVATSGVYTYDITIRVKLNGGQDFTLPTITRKAAVVARDNSAFGPGWNLDVLTSLAINTNGILMIDGNGDSRIFNLPDMAGNCLPDNGGSQEFGQLVFEDGVYVYTDKKGNRSTFDGTGKLMQISTPSAPSKPMRFSYSGDRITSITFPRLELATFNDANSDNLIDSINGPGSRIYELTHDSNDDLTEILDPEGNHKTSEYDSNHRMTRDPWGPLDQTFTYDASTGMLTGMDRGEGDTVTITSKLQKALTASSPLGTQDVVATVTDALNRTTTYRLDKFGRIVEIVAPDSTTQSWQRNDAGLAVLYTDELGRITRMAYDARGDLLGEILPDGSSFHFTYDNSFHNVTSYTDTLGRVTTFRYDPDTGDLLSSTDALGGVVQQVWSNGLLMSMADELGQRTRHRYNGDRRMVAVEDALGNATSFTFDAAGNIETITDALGRVTTTVYDGLRRIVEIVDANGGVMTMTYDAIGDLTSQTDQLGRRTDYVYSQRALLTSFTEAVGEDEERTTSLLYDVVGNLLSTEDALNRVTSFAYDSRDRLVRTIEAYGTPLARTNTLVYDAASNLVAMVNARGFTSSLVYDNRDRLIQTIEAVGTSVQRSTSMAYDSESNLVSATDALGRRTSYVYDALNRFTSMTEAVGTTVQRTSTMAYDAVSNLVSSTDTLGRVTSYVYNAVNLLTQATEAVGTSVQRSTSVAYDAVYNVINTTDALGRHTSYTFDALDRMTAMTEAVSTSAQRTSTMAYDAVSNLTGTTDPLGRRSAYAYDALNRMTSMTEAVGTGVQRTTTMAYDAVDNYVSTTDPLGRVTNFSFDALNRLVSVTEAASTGVQRTSTMAYDANDNLVSATNPRGVVSAYTFDALDRMTAMTEAVGSAVERTSTFAFDAMNNLVSSTDALARHTSYAFDALDRMTSMTEAVGTSVQRTSTFAFDAMNNMTGSTDALGRRTAFGFDALDRTVSMTEAVGAAVERTSTWAYDANNNLVGQTDALGRVSAYNFDALDRMTSMTEAVSSSVQRTSTWTYDAASNLLSSTDALGRVSSYGYDALDRMTVMTEAVGTSVQRTSTFAFDAVSNLVGSTDALGRHTSYAFDALDRMTGMTEAVSLSLQRTSTWAYDLNSNLVSQTDALGRVTAYTFDALDRLTVMTEAVGTSVQRTSTFVYDAVDNYVSTIDALGRVTGFSFDSLDRMTAMTEAVGTSVERTSTFAFDAVDNLINQTDALGRHTAYAFDALNRMVTMTEATGTAVERTSTFAFDAVDNLLLQTDPLGRVTSYAFDALNRMTGMTEAVGTGVQRTSTFAFDAVDNLLNQTDALGRHTAYGFDALDRMVTMTEATGTGVQRTSTVVYDLMDNVVARIDPLGHATSYGYDALDRRINTIDALNQRVTVVYDAVDNVVAVVNKRNFTTSYAYDALDRQTTRTDALNQVASTVYDAVDNVLAYVDERGNATSYAYDALNRQVSRKDALNHTTSTVYDAVSNVVASIDALGFASTFTYDALNRMVTAKAPSGGISTTIYDAVSNVVGTIDPVGNRTTHVYDALDRRTQTIDARGGVVTMLYDLVSNNTAIVDPVGNRTTMVYDALNRQVERVDPLGNSSTMVYDADDRLTSKTDRNGRRMDYTYDAIDRETGETWVASNGTTVDNTLTFTYDPNDNLLTAADNDGAYTFTYDALDRTVTQKDVFGLTLTFGYDATSNRTSVQDSLGGVQTSVYDAVNRLTRRSFTNGTTPLRADFTYTARDQVETVTRYSDLAGTSLVGTSSYTYDSTGRMSTLEHRNASSTVLASYVYAYDLADRLTSESINGLVRYYVYDATNQLTSDDGTGYTYDLNGNRNDGSYSAGPSNQLQTDGTWNYDWDGDDGTLGEGNLTKKTRISDGQTWTYGYDHRNMMIFAEQRATDGGTLLQRIEFEYDVFGNRIEKSVTTGSTTVHRFSWDGRDIWADLDGSSSLTTRRLFGDGVNEPLARIAGSAEWYLQDRMGSVRDVVNSGGTVIAHVTYDAWGLVTGSSGSTDRYLAFGYQLDAESGLYYVMARYMDPVTHLFLQQDPIYADVNGYRYAGNSPTNATDPTGQFLITKTEAGLLHWKKKLDAAQIYYETFLLSDGSSFFFVPESERSKAKNIGYQFGEREDKYVQNALTSQNAFVVVGQGNGDYAEVWPSQAKREEIARFAREAPALKAQREGPPDAPPFVGYGQQASTGKAAALQNLHVAQTIKDRQVFKDGTYRLTIAVLTDAEMRRDGIPEERIADLKKENAKYARTVEDLYKAVGLVGTLEDYEIVDAIVTDPKTGKPQIGWDGRPISAILIRTIEDQRVVRAGFPLTYPTENGLVLYGYHIFRSEDRLLAEAQLEYGLMAASTGLVLTIGNTAIALSRVPNEPLAKFRRPRGGNAGVCAPRVLTKQEITDLRSELKDHAREAHAAIEEAANEGIKNIERGGKVLKTGTDTRGPVLSVVKDLDTGQVYYGQNQGKVINNLHPLLKQRLKQYLDAGNPEWTRAIGKAGSHSELDALNQALWAREAAGKPVNDLSSFGLYNIRTQDLAKSAAGTPIPRCKACEALTQGIHDVTD